MAAPPAGRRVHRAGCARRHLYVNDAFCRLYGFDKPRILGSNIVNQRVAAGLLTRRGRQVTVVGNGREATAAIREWERTPGRHVRIVAMTAHAMKGDKERCPAAGMDGYLSKPIEQCSLYAVVEA